MLTWPPRMLVEVQSRLKLLVSPFPLLVKNHALKLILSILPMQVSETHSKLHSRIPSSMEHAPILVTPKKMDRGLLMLVKPTLPDGLCDTLNLVYSLTNI